MSASMRSRDHRIPMAHEAVVHRVVRAARQSSGIEPNAQGREASARALERLRDIAAAGFAPKVDFARAALPEGFRPAIPTGQAAEQLRKRAEAAVELEDAVLATAVDDAIAMLADAVCQPTAISGAGSGRGGNEPL